MSTKTCCPGSQRGAVCCVGDPPYTHFRPRSPPSSFTGYRSSSTTCPMPQLAPMIHRACTPSSSRVVVQFLHTDVGGLPYANSGDVPGRQSSRSRTARTIVCTTSTSSQGSISRRATTGTSPTRSRGSRLKGVERLALSTPVENLRSPVRLRGDDTAHRSRLA